MEIQLTKIDKEKAWELRHKVMWSYKDFDYIKLKDDDLGIHFGLFKENKLVTVISLFINNGECQFRKFATLQEEQGNGYGSKLLNFAINEVVKKHGINRIWCNARTGKVNFYKKFGFEETTHHFIKDDKSYIIMEKYIEG